MERYIAIRINDREFKILLSVIVHGLRDYDSLAMILERQGAAEASARCSEIANIIENIYHKLRDDYENGKDV